LTEALRMPYRVSIQTQICIILQSIWRLLISPPIYRGNPSEVHHPDIPMLRYQLFMK